MEDEELGEHWGKRPDDLIAWAIGPVREGWLTLRLRHAGEDSSQATLEVAIPPQAALYLAEELTRQAKKLMPAASSR
jgi:hypothetical protein